MKHRRVPSARNANLFELVRRRKFYDRKIRQKQQQLNRGRKS